MKKIIFRSLVFMMSLSLIGIILVQVYWINLSAKNYEEQFKYLVKQILGNVANKLESQETYNYLSVYRQLKDSIGKDPEQSELLDFFLVQRNLLTNQTIVYSNNIVSKDYHINSSIFDKKKDSIFKTKSFTSRTKAEIYNDNSIDNVDNNDIAHLKIEKIKNLEILDKAQFQIFFKEIASLKPIKDRIPEKKLKVLLKNEIEDYEINTPFEYAIYNKGILTEVKSYNFEYNINNTYGVSLFVDNDGNSNYQLLVSFPKKQTFIYSFLMNITSLSIIFTLIIILTYVNALNQLIKQRQISEIKTDFINNMTHEFKTPIATINLALDAIKNPKIIDDKNKIQNYLQIVRDENNRLHAQVENILRISKLENKELDINKEPFNIHEIIEDAVGHVNLIIEDRKGKITMHFEAKKNLVLLNDVHFTNVIVNILENAVKYSIDQPLIINIYTENVKNNLLIKIKDQGIGIDKQTQKRVFEKFYREHTGDIHNVKGHGLGLAYVKRIVDDHNGHIFVESEKGKGSTFIIKLPLIN